MKHIVRSHLIGSMKNLDMNPETYKLRRQVIELIYEVNDLLRKNNLPVMPRVDVRITERHPDFLGEARFSRPVIWISEKAVKERNLRMVVYHELLHTIYGVQHDENNILMRKAYTDLSKERCQEEFLNYARKK